MSSRRNLGPAPRRPAALLTLGLSLSLCGLIGCGSPPTRAATAAPSAEPAPSVDRMAWWREARFGMFIHWGLYSVLGGEYRGEPVGGVAEWIQHIGRIPNHEYSKLQARFNPVDFDADEWVTIAKRAGMKYIVITTKHHDGFALFDSKVTDYDAADSPFGRDVMAELAAACRRHDIRVGWYHSILDWHHPDHLPRQDWHEMPDESAVYRRYVEYLRSQVSELLTNYGPVDILWFDGEWETTWTNAYAAELEQLVRSLQPNIVVNNRIGKVRYPEVDATGPAVGGDFGTPEQHIPATGTPGVDWETCMTLNDAWGYKAADDNWKSDETLLRNLIDVASKGGNFLLNVGPTGTGVIPAESRERLARMGEWLSRNGEAIYGTDASPFGYLPWGRATQRRLDDHTTRLYLHVFEWPTDGWLSVPGLANHGVAATLIDTARRPPLAVVRHEDSLRIRVPPHPVDPVATVVVLDIASTPKVVDPPRFEVPLDRFVETSSVGFVRSGSFDVRYTTDGTTPTGDSPIAPIPWIIDDTSNLAIRHFRGDQPVSGVRRQTFTRVEPRPAVELAQPEFGIRYRYVEGTCNSVHDLGTLPTVTKGVLPGLDLTPRRLEEHYGLEYSGFLKIPRDAMYLFRVRSDDGSLLTIDGELVVDHDGIHAATEKSGSIALAAGLHRIEVLFFEKGGDETLEVSFEGPDGIAVPITSRLLYHDAGDLEF